MKEFFLKENGDWEVLKNIIKKEGNRKVFYYKGYRCEIKRPFRGIEEEIKDNSRINLCGYIETVNHKTIHNMSYNFLNNYLECHWGLTYSNTENDITTIGFDCAHGKDVWLYGQPVSPDMSYKTFKFVEEELKSLVDQIEKLEINTKDLANCIDNFYDSVKCIKGFNNITRADFKELIDEF